MAHQLSQQEALHKAAALCSSGEQCRNDILEKLAKWGIPPEQHDPIIERLVRERFLDEKRFCKGYVADKFKFNKWGKIKIRYQLRLKQIDPTLIEEALLNVDNETYLDTLAGLLADKERRINDPDSRSRTARLYRFAASRGFEPDAIFKVLKADGSFD